MRGLQREGHLLSAQNRPGAQKKMNTPKMFLASQLDNVQSWSATLVPFWGAVFVRNRRVADFLDTAFRVVVPPGSLLRLNLSARRTAHRE